MRNVIGRTLILFNSSMKLSFIVPVYNVEQYLRKCVESLVNQDYSDYEIILVDDGSTDGSDELCDALIRELKSEDRRLKNIQLRVIHQANGGLSAARNAGLKVAKGEYVCFVDSDDYWEENVLGGLMEQVERENLDVLRFDYQNVRIVGNGKNGENGENGGKYEVFEPNKTPRYIDKCNEVVDGETYLNTRMGYACYAVMYIIRRELLIGTKTEINPVPAINIDKEDINKKAESSAYAASSVIANQSANEQDSLQPNYQSPSANTDESDLHDSLQKNVDCINSQESEKTGNPEDCLFTEGIHFEDVEWLPRMMLGAKRVNSTTTTVYNYLVRQGSITKTQGNKEKIRKNVEDRLLIIDRYRQYIERYPDCQWLRNMQSGMAEGVLTTVAREFYEDRTKYIGQLRDMKVFPLTIANQGKTYKRRALLINLLWADLYCRLMRHV